MKRKYICLVVIVIALAAMFVGCIDHKRDKQIEPFQAHINEYTSSLSLVPSGKESYVSGKVITVDMANNKIDQTYFELSPDMAARSPNEVDSLVR